MNATAVAIAFVLGSAVGSAMVFISRPGAPTWRRAMRFLAWNSVVTAVLAFAMLVIGTSNETATLILFLCPLIALVTARSQVRGIRK